MGQPAGPYRVADHFSSSEVSVDKMYRKLIAAARKLGPVAESPKKTSIHLERKTAFAAVYVRKSYINLVVKADHEINSLRVRKIEKVSRNRVFHTIRLDSVADIDGELLGWIKDAYLLSQ